MGFFETLCLLPCLVAVVAVIVGARLRSMQPYRILPVTTHPCATPCQTFVETGAYQCLWKKDGPRPCSLHCSIKRCRLEEPEVVGVPLLPAPLWGMETLLTAQYVKP